MGDQEYILASHKLRHDFVLVKRHGTFIDRLQRFATWHGVVPAAADTVKLVFADKLLHIPLVLAGVLAVVSFVDFAAALIGYVELLGGVEHALKCLKGTDLLRAIRFVEPDVEVF